MMIAERSVGGLGPAVSLRRPGNNSEISAQAVEAENVGAVMALPARDTRPLEERGLGTDDLVHRHWRGGRGIAAHPVGGLSHVHYGVAHCGVQRVGL
ncbi:hypothetical protein C4B68_38980 [Streptomyces dengpaensis]|uniref:Uncharacterized protein n=2 Tax=Streptomyces TaxID=1883 RepID=A0ABM6T117_9ACTN|nr:hypothetical protein C4B68_38980 [Streptomyces dengpaensis]PIB04242.1 hypothetical protein B1C81_33815 [Streptomyces sp. HG99]